MLAKEVFTKICPCCKRLLSLDNFFKCKSRKDGLQHKCKECKSQAFKNWYNKNTEYNIKTVREWQKK